MGDMKLIEVIEWMILRMRDCQIDQVLFRLTRIQGVSGICTETVRWDCIERSVVSINVR